MNTLFGELVVEVNGKNIDFIAIEISNEFRHFRVDKRYLITLDYMRVLGDNTVITCYIPNARCCLFGSSTGEDLAQVTFESYRKKMSIGTFGDLLGVTYSYPNFGIQLNVSSEADYKNFTFLIAWCDSDLAFSDSTEFLTDATWCIDYDIK